MELSNYHRSTLIDQLFNCLHLKKDIAERLNSENAKDSLAYSEAVQIEDFLNNRQIEIIRECLISNDLDH